MAIWRKIEPRMWGDAKVRKLSPAPPSGQTLWFRLLTGPETTLIPGVLVGFAEGMAAALGWPIEAFREAFAEVSREGLAKADWDAGLVWVPKAPLHNKPQSPNVVTSWRVAWDELPDSPMKAEVLQGLRGLCEGMGEGFSKAFRKAFPEAYAKPCPNQEQEQEQEQDQEAEDPDSAVQSRVRDDAPPPPPRASRQIPSTHPSGPSGTPSLPCNWPPDEDAADDPDVRSLGDVVARADVITTHELELQRGEFVRSLPAEQAHRVQRFNGDPRTAHGLDAAVAAYGADLVWLVVRWSWLAAAEGRLEPKLLACTFRGGGFDARLEQWRKAQEHDRRRERLGIEQAAEAKPLPDHGEFFGLADQLADATARLRGAS